MEEGDIYQPKHGWHFSFLFTRVVTSLRKQRERCCVRREVIGCVSVHVRADVVDPQTFRIFLLRRLRLPIPLAAKACRCGRRCFGCWEEGTLLWSPLQPGYVVKMAPGSTSSVMGVLGVAASRSGVALERSYPELKGQTHRPCGGGGWAVV